jgi:DNA polymerase III subunit delta'
MNELDQALPWHDGPWQTVSAYGGNWPHALLLFGQAGIGKVRFARHLAASMLCEATVDGHACGTCASCTWLSHGNHPDLRLVRPDALAMAEGTAEEAEGDEPQAAAEGDDGKATKRAPSREIRIEQVRALQDFLGIATHRGGRRVVVAYPAEAMNVQTANAFLKMLEEPPDNTVLLLVTSSLDRILPTIRSRCRLIPMATPPHELALAWLTQQGVKHADERLAQSGGAPLAALVSAQGPDDDAAHERLIEALIAPDRLDVLALAEALAKTSMPRVVGWIQRWVFDCLSYRLAGAIRYHPAHQAQLARFAAAMDIQRAVDYWRKLAAERRVSEHPVNARLFFENLLLDYVDATASTGRSDIGRKS